MTDLLRHRLISIAAAILLIVGSAVSAAMMAPDRVDAAEAHITLMGMSLDDVCGGESAHDHHCPFCHLVPDTPVPAPAEITSVLLPFAAWTQANDLHRTAQARDHGRSPSAPPTVI
ncbi:hypothetical protein [Arenibacterium halophilum]|uniref:DUF2946 domain-containing protein n=1 Tax=Arenibacterium halophilum TaxID=2583821 RepID=A0ABY2X6D3_9RHOB|nr:hypothetical protein [Arenibacterium halophilum]TMV10663.1 hypothetical protein FGK64_18000 [Arenibacterium halophilum]